MNRLPYWALLTLGISVNVLIVAIVWIIGFATGMSTADLVLCLFVSTLFGIWLARVTRKLT